MEKLAAALSFCWRYGPPLIFKTVEGATVVAVFGVAVYAGFWIVFGNEADPHHLRMILLVQTVSENWKAFLLLAVPLFYRTIRTFMEEVQEAAGMKRRSLPQSPIPPQDQNPSGEKS